MEHFCGNVLELHNDKGQALLVMSKTAHQHFTTEQKTVFESLGLELVVADIPVMEAIGGGSARCCIAELFE